MKHLVKGNITDTFFPCAPGGLNLGMSLKKQHPGLSPNLFLEHLGMAPNVATVHPSKAKKAYP